MAHTDNQNDPSVPEAGHAQQVNVAESDLIDINDIDLFATLVGRWHQNKVAVLRHMQTIPVGTEMELKVGDKAHTVLLEGDILFGFRAGIEVALIEMGILPFVASTEAKAEDTTDAADPSQG